MSRQLSVLLDDCMNCKCGFGFTEEASVLHVLIFFFFLKDM